ncbi:tail fiber domain-containing protein [Nostoc sp.]|uniref:tail fiber domain-containing protein n=1 Tax=Nostoc sp. TaxID=1180 RepID=UPI002FFAF140
MSNISDGRLDLVFGAPENWPVLRVTQAKQLNLENADFNLEANRSILFGGNGQISAVGDLSFLSGATSPTEQMKIFANGNIGIGTDATIPTNKLEVAGTIKATDLEVSSTVTASKFVGEVAGLADTLNDKISKTGGTITGPLEIQNNLTLTSSLILQNVTVNKFSSDGTFNGNSDSSVPTEKAVKTYVDTKVAGIRSSQWLESGGNLVYNVGNNNVGIGISQPSAKLEVAGNLKAASINLQTGVAVNQFSNDTNLGNSDQAVPTQNAVKTYVDGKFNSPTGNSPWETVNNISISYSKGNVGIGTTNPESKLHVVDGNIRVDNGEYQSWGSITFRPDVDKSGDGIINFLNSNGSENIRIDANGNVGIGTIKPEAKLHVQMNFQDSSYGGNIKLFRTSGKGNDFSYDGGDDGIFAFTNYGKDSGKTQFLWQKPDDSGMELLTIFNSGRVEADVYKPSSRELKENITDLSTEEAIETLANLNPAKFYYRQDEEKKLRVGFIAEDVPELLATQDRRAISALDIVAVLTKVIQQQQEELSFLKERLNALEATA